MIHPSCRSGLTVKELILVLVVVGIGLAVLVPGVQRARVNSRRTHCLHNLKQIGLGLRNHESALGAFPPSCHVTRDPDGNITSVDGWSWWVDMLPYIEQKSLSDTLDTEKGLPLQQNPDGTNSHAKALATSFLDLICPSFSGNPYVNMRTKAEAITNYKAMGATHLESLNVASPNPTTPKYAPDSDRHPDGAIYPGSTHGIAGFKLDGTILTIMVVESKEQNVARWTVGNQCTVVGLPPVVTFAPSPGYSYYHPTGFTVGWIWEESTIPPEINKTYLDWDYEKNPYNDGGVSTPSAAATGPIRYGPSSDHPGVTNHLCADGSAHSLSNQIDAALYMFYITRNGGEPTYSRRYYEKE